MSALKRKRLVHDVSLEFGAWQAPTACPDAIVVIGGDIGLVELDSLRVRIGSGPRLQWISTDRASDVVRNLLPRQVAGLVVNGLATNERIDRLIGVAVNRGFLVEFATWGGIASLEHAIRALEPRIAARAQAAAGSRFRRGHRHRSDDGAIR